MITTRYKLLIVLLACLLLSVLSTQAQNPPATSAPGLLLIVVLDDSSTMSTEGRLNSAQTQSMCFECRDLSDPDNLRWDEVRRMVDLLNSDQRRTHQVGVLSFDGVARGWLTGDSGQEIITVGANSDQSAYAGFVQNMLTHETGEAPGNTLLALQEVESVLNTWARRNPDSGLKPVVVLLTDDVPVEQFASSAWATFLPGPNVWQTYRDEFVEAAVSLRDNTVSYNSEFCRTGAGVPMIASFAIGTATWVNYDGSIPNENARLATPAQGNFFEQFATNLGMFRPDGTPYVERIDPELADVELLRLDLRNATNALYSYLRCTQQRDLPSTIDGQRELQTAQISALMPQFRLIIDRSTSHNVVVIPPGDAAPLASADFDGVQRYTGRNYEIWSFGRDALLADAAWQSAGYAWAGDWRIEVAGANAAASSVVLDAEFELGTISWRFDGPNNLSPNIAGTVNFSLLFSDANTGTERVFTDSTVIGRVDASLQRRNADVQTVSVNANGGRYEARIAAQQIQQVGTYELQPLITINPQITQLLGLEDRATFALSPAADVEVVDSLQINLREPSENLRNDFTSTCLNNAGFVPFEVSLQRASGSSANDAITEENLNQSASITVYYQQQQAAATQPDPHRLATLGWNLLDLFVGEVDCRDLPPVANPEAGALQLEVSISQSERYQRSVSYTYQPTPMPTPTPEPPPTPTPIPPAATPVPDVETLPLAVGTWLANPDNEPIMLMALGAVLLVVAFVGWRSYVQQQLPLRGVELAIYDRDGLQQPSTPLLPPFKRYNALTQQHTVLDPTKPRRSEAARLFTVQPAVGALMITMHQPDMRVNRVRRRQDDPQLYPQINIEIVAPSGLRFEISNPNGTQDSRI
jgi:hypothetical protein